MIELPRKIKTFGNERLPFARTSAMRDFDDGKHIQTIEKFLQVSVERMLDKGETTNEKLAAIASSINVITEFMVAEAEYARFVYSNLDKQMRKEL